MGQDSFLKVNSRPLSALWMNEGDDALTKLNQRQEGKGRILLFTCELLGKKIESTETEPVIAKDW